MSDGTEAGTTRVADINPGPGGSAIGRLTGVNGTLFFGADDGACGVELWKAGDFASPSPPGGCGSNGGGSTGGGSNGGGSTGGGSTGGGATGGGSTGGGSSTPAVPTAAQIAAALGVDIKALVKTLTKLRTRKLVSAGGFSAKGLDALGAGRFTVTLTGATAGKAGAAAKAVTIAKGTRSVTEAGRYTMKVKLTKHGKRLLRGARRVKAKLTLRFQPTAGATQVRSAKLTLKR
jgi:hypothetical protein